MHLRLVNPSSRRVLVSMLIVSAEACGDSGCGNTVVSDIPSPDSRRHLVVFTRDCGATTDFSTHVSVLTSARTARGGGNVFVADANHGRAVTDSARGPWVAARWLDARTIEIRYDAAARVFKQEVRHDDTNLQFIAEARPISRP
jgi:hypothetical protein